MRTVWLCLSFAGLVAAYPAPAQADCQCVAAGKRYQLGEVACLSLPEGERLARCSLVLNNSSWTKLQESCPVGFDLPAPDTRTMASAFAGDRHDSHAPARQSVRQDH